MFTQETYRLIIQTLSDYAIFTMDLSGLITSWNIGAENIFGYKKEEILGKHGRIIFTEEENKKLKFEEEFNRALKEGRAEDERWHIKKDKSLFWASGAIMPFKNDSGDIAGLVKIVRDRTPQRLSRTELERSNEDLEKFALVIAHDFKAPLNMIDSYMTLLMREAHQLSPKAQEFGKYIDEKIKFLKKMVERVLAYAKVNQPIAKFSKINLNEICTQSVSSLIEEIQNKKASIDWKELPYVCGDEVLLIVLFQNLISNALKYCRQQPHIEITSSQKGEWTVISVKDNGMGITPENRQKIFFPFVQLDNTNEHEGHGLGLATVRRIIEAHGGKIWVESEVGEGTTFHFTLRSMSYD